MFIVLQAYLGKYTGKEIAVIQYRQKDYYIKENTLVDKMLCLHKIDYFLLYFKLKYAGG